MGEKIYTGKYDTNLKGGDVNSQISENSYTGVNAIGLNQKNASQIRITVGNSTAQIGGFDSRAIQAAIDYVAGVGGGTVELTEGSFSIYDAIYLRDNVFLLGQGEKTVLKKCNAVRSPLLIDADKYEKQVLLAQPEGFEVGMGVSIGDEKYAVQHLVSVRTIIWKQGNAIGFDKFFETTQMVSRGAFAQITFPMIYGLYVKNTGVFNITIDGNRNNNPVINSWADGGIYLLNTDKAVVSGCNIHNINADGISLNTSHDVIIKNCNVYDNARMGIHIGTGSQNTVVKGCRIYRNGLDDSSNRDGVYLCFSAQNGRYENNEVFENMGAGIAIGHKDSNNIFMNNIIRNNYKYGVFYRSDTYMSDNNIFKDCVIEDNGNEQEGYGFHISGDANGTVLEKCTIRDTRPEGLKLQKFSLYVGDDIKKIEINKCKIE